MTMLSRWIRLTSTMVSFFGSLVFGSECVAEPVQLKVVPGSTRGSPATLLSISIYNSSTGALCVHASDLPDSGHFEKENDISVSELGGTRLDYRGVIAEFPPPEEFFRILPPGFSFAATYRLDQDFALRKGSTYVVTYSLEGYDCSLLEHGFPDRLPFHDPLVAKSIVRFSGSLKFNP